MAKYGNSGGANKGKKYRKLKGDEVATPKDLARARRFLNWYAAYCKVLARIIKGFDLDVAHDTVIFIYDGIALKGLVINNYKVYFLRAYHTTLLKARKDHTAHLGTTVSVEDTPELTELPESDFNVDGYEDAIETINAEVFKYVRENYDPISASLFEMYIALSPGISYNTLGALLGYSPNRIYLKISVIKADLQRKYKRRKEFLLSLV